MWSQWREACALSEERLVLLVERLMLSEERGFCSQWREACALSGERLVLSVERGLCAFSHVAVLLPRLSC